MSQSLAALAIEQAAHGGDLAAARTAWLKQAEEDAEELKRRKESDFLNYTDRNGHKADFHALRHTFISNLAAGGVHPKTAQVLARHSTFALTMERYSHSRSEQEVAALSVLPHLPRPTKKTTNAPVTDGKNGNPVLASCLALLETPAEISEDSERLEGGKQGVAQAMKEPTDTAKKTVILHARSNISPLWDALKEFFKDNPTWE